MRADTLTPCERHSTRGAFTILHEPEASDRLKSGSAPSDRTLKKQAARKMRAACFTDALRAVT